MANRRPARQRAVLHYPSHLFKPEDLLSFIELRPFTRAWDQLELDDTAFSVLQVVLMTRPQAGEVIEGTGGVRKLRFAPPGWARGKSGALRICYAYFAEVATIVLAFVYRKGEKDDLNEDEKELLRTAVQRVEQLLLSRSYRVKCGGKAEER